MPRRLRPDELADAGQDLAAPLAAVEDAVVAHRRLQVLHPLHIVCAAMVWPGAEMSSNSPSTVISAVCWMADGTTSSPRTVMRPSARSCFWKKVSTVCR